MSGGDFGFGEVNEYYPTYGGVDWYDVYTVRYKKHDLPAWFEATDGEGELMMQLHQENTAFYLNKAEPDLDALVVTDERDGCGIWWSRSQIGNEKFEALLRHFFGEVMVVNTKYPLKMVAETILKMMEVDVEEVPGVPEGWS